MLQTNTPGHRHSVQIIRLTGLLLSSIASLSCSSNRGDEQVLSFWAMGREGEVVRELIPEFERRNPSIHVKVQQIPWGAAHEKLLTAYAGGVMPDLFQLGTTWLPEFVALNALAPIDPAHSRAAESAGDFFPAALESNQLKGRLWGLPWYVDTRLLYVRTDLLKQAGYEQPPETWEAWSEMMARIRSRWPNGNPQALLQPVNDWQTLVIIALQSRVEMLRDGDRYGNFSSERFQAVFQTYIDWFRLGFASLDAAAQTANTYRDFAEGRFVFLVSGPWTLGTFRERLPERLQTEWSTVPVPALSGTTAPGVSITGGASLVISRTTRHTAWAEALAAYLTEPQVQARFYALTGDLPTRISAWDAPALADDRKVRAFRRQLERLGRPPAIPEWERIAAKLAYHAERTIRGEVDPKTALHQLDGDVDQILEKRRWLLHRQR